MFLVACNDCQWKHQKDQSKFNFSIVASALFDAVAVKFDFGTKTSVDGEGNS